MPKTKLLPRVNPGDAIRAEDFNNLAQQLELLLSIQESTESVVSGAGQFHVGPRHPGPHTAEIVETVSGVPSPTHLPGGERVAFKFMYTSFPLVYSNYGLADQANEVDLTILNQGTIQLYAFAPWHLGVRVGDTVEVQFFNGHWHVRKLLAGHGPVINGYLLSDLDAAIGSDDYDLDDSLDYDPYGTQCTDQYESTALMSIYQSQNGVWCDTGDRETVVNRSETVSFNSGDFIIATRIGSEYRPVVGAGAGEHIIQFEVVSPCPDFTLGVTCECVTAVVVRTGCNSAVEIDDLIIVWDPDLCHFNLPIQLLAGLRGTAHYLKYTPSPSISCPENDESQTPCNWVVTDICCAEQVYV